ncbi:hypothetical protein [Brevundimonas sp. NIBR11]|uniref:hypothetical protein n=1 Tax=Brevundimonas sp. NIBR11 TaxID=3015999 RepID=UPI0022EFFCDC|nr:hypothetical protein [Brevundimonas sp. NIBR11]WGM30554.1 hypothetical protein KKHFBJBL_00779 [Brevundimonas sp. NIBR11]
MFDDGILFLATAAQIGGMILNVVVCGAAILWGARTERLAAISIVIASVLSMLLQNWSDETSPQWNVLIIDAANLAVFLYLLVRKHRVWLLFACAFQLLAVLSHMGMLIDPSIMARAYISTLYVMFYGLMIALAFGIWEGRSREERVRVASAEGNIIASPYDLPDA